jgi:hypothetical protein
MRRLEAERPGVFALTVAGPGSEGWREAAEGLPVRLAGRLTEARLAAEYREADLCVVPSRGGESFGLVALEALAHGVPVVASRIRGYADWLAAAEAGCLVAPGDAEALAEALRGVVKDPGRYAEWTRRGPELAAGYGWDLIAARVIAAGLIAAGEIMAGLIVAGEIVAGVVVAGLVVAIASAIFRVSVGIAATGDLVDQIGIKTVLAESVRAPDLVQGVREVDERQ